MITGQTVLNSLEKLYTGARSSANKHTTWIQHTVKSFFSANNEVNKDVLREEHSAGPGATRSRDVAGASGNQWAENAKDSIHGLSRKLHQQVDQKKIDIEKSSGFINYSNEMRLQGEKRAIAESCQRLWRLVEKLESGIKYLESNAESGNNQQLTDVKDRIEVICNGLHQLADKKDLALTDLLDIQQIVSAGRSEGPEIRNPTDEVRGFQSRTVTRAKTATADFLTALDTIRS